MAGGDYAGDTVEGDQCMTINNSWGYARHGSYEEYDHSDGELYVYDQCCKNCRYFRFSDEYGAECMRPGADEFDAPADDGSTWCEDWKGGRN